MNIRALIHILVLLALPAGAVRAELTLEDLRGKFETALENQKLEHGVKKLKLRDGYVGALERLKTRLGREGNLEAATQVLAEIEQVKGGTDVSGLPDSADYRLKSLRAKWEDAVAADASKNARAIAKLAETYLDILEQRKSSLTRAGKIRDALLIQEETQRIAEIEVVASALTEQAGDGDLLGDYGTGNLALGENGAKASAPNNPELMIDGIVTDYEEGNRWAWGGNPCHLLVKLRKIYVLDRIRLLLREKSGVEFRYRLEVSVDGKAWDLIEDRSKRSVPGGWRDIEFKPRDVRHIRVTGLGNTLNEGFTLVEVEAYSPES